MKKSAFLTTLFVRSISLTGVFAFVLAFVLSGPRECEAFAVKSAIRKEFPPGFAEQFSDEISELKELYELDDVRPALKADFAAIEPVPTQVLTEEAPTGVDSHQEFPLVYLDYINKARIPVNLLSFDGGGIRGLYSARALVLAFQGLMGDQTFDQKWIKDARSYVEAMTSGDGQKIRWMIWAQQMDDLSVRPLVPGLRSWLELPSNDPLAEELVKVDLFFDYYLTFVVAISGTSTGGLLAGGIACGMTLTQLAALYMPRETCENIFRKEWWRFDGLWQAKYTQAGVTEIIQKIVTHILPCDKHGKPTSTKFIDIVADYNARLESKLLGLPLQATTKNRMSRTLEAALKKKKQDPKEAGEMVENLDNMAVEASRRYLKIPERFRHRERDNGKVGLNWLEYEEVHDLGRRHCSIFPTRFVITARCANNEGAVFFDSLERSEPPGEHIYAYTRTSMPHDDVKVNEVSLEDVLMSTSAAPSFFKAHEIGNLSFQDGGVVANDPGLVNGAFGFCKFQAKTWGELDDSGRLVKYERIPALRLLRVGTGKSVVQHEAFPPWKGQGKLPLATELAPMFMSADTDRTDLLCQEISRTLTLTSVKLNSVIPREKDPSKGFEKIDPYTLAKMAGNARVKLLRKEEEDKESDPLPMDEVATVYAINSLFASIHQELDEAITVPTNILLEQEENTSDKYAKELVGTVKETRDFLKNLTTVEIDSLSRPRTSGRPERSPKPIKPFVSSTEQAVPVAPNTDQS